MKAVERLFKYLKYKGIPHTRFEKEIGLSNGYLNTQLKRGADLGEGVILKVIENSLDLNMEWLLTGKGEMVKSRESASQVNEPAAAYGKCGQCDLMKRVIDSQDTAIQLLRAELKRCGCSDKDDLQGNGHQRKEAG